jgi:2-polyprenyl-3-methyl-5-hydroxy-6-metoxy-1,4-benzoquinol methylase
MSILDRKLKYTSEFVIPGKVPYKNWQEHINRYLFAKVFVKGKVTLDIACGTGYRSNILTKGSNIVIGGDISRNAIAYAKKAFHAGNLNFILLNVHYLPFRERAFDVVVSFEHLEKPERFFRRSKEDIDGMLNN